MRRGESRGFGRLGFVLSCRGGGSIGVGLGFVGLDGLYTGFCYRGVFCWDLRGFRYGESMYWLLTV